MANEVVEFTTILDDIKELVTTQPVLSGILIVVSLGVIFVLIKQRKLKSVIRCIVKEIIDEQKAQGKTVEVMVDDMIAKAIARVKAEPDKTDKYLLWILNSKWFRADIINIAKKAIEFLTGDTPEEVTLTEKK